MSAIKIACGLAIAFGAGAIVSNPDILDSLSNKDKVAVQPTTPNEQTTSTIGNIAANTSTTMLPLVNFDTASINCSEKTTLIIIDERARAGANLSILKAIDANVAGATSSQLPVEVVYPFVQLIAEANSHPEMDSPVELDNFPAGVYTIPVSCSLNGGSVFIP